MAQNQERYDHGPQQIVQMPVASATVIYKGDFICLNPTSGKAVPAGDLTDAGDAAANREAAADNFIGISLVGSASGETADIAVDISNTAVFALELQAAASLSFGAQLEIYASADNASDYLMVAGTTSKVAFAVEAITSGTTIRASLLPQARLGRASPQT